MPLKITPNPRGSANLSIAANLRARMASVVSVGWDYVTGKPNFSTTYQPLDSDLTAIAALSTTSYGRAFLALADAAAGRAALGVGQAWTTFTPTFSFTGGTTPAAVNQGSAYSLVGKNLYYRVCVQITYAGAPSVVSWTLPNSATSKGEQIVYGLNISAAAFILGRLASGATGVPLVQNGAAAAVGASGQFITICGVIEIT